MKSFWKIAGFSILLIGLLIILQSCPGPKTSAPTVTTTNVTDFTQTTAVSGGNVTNNGGEDVTARGVCWGTTQDPTTDPPNKKTTDGTGNGSFTSTITDLTANATYHVRAYATNAVGTGYGNQVGFTTLANKTVADFIASPSTITAGQSVQFTDQSSNTPTSWSWNFGDGITNTSQSPSHTYSIAGTYTVSLTATNSSGSDTETKTNYITVNAVVVTPIAAFTASQTIINAGQSVQFTDQSSNTPTSWSWNFGDGITSTLQSPLHTYSTAGTYTVSLTATNSSGSDPETKNNYIIVNAVVITPVAAFTASITAITAGQSVQFTDQSSNSPTSWSWNFGDGNTSTSQSPSHVYSTAGTYTVSLTATNSSGSDTETKSNYVNVNLCPTYLTRTHTSGAVAPVNKTITYNVVESNLTGSNKCWITSNLGASNQAGSATDATEAAAGWYWQFNREMGFKHDGTTSTPAYWAVSVELGDWIAARDPCTILLGTGWRIPTNTEWTNADNNGGWGNYSNTFASDLKLHAAGYLYSSDGGFTILLYSRGVAGYYWSSNQYSDYNGYGLYFQSSFSVIGSGNSKAIGHSVRCIKD